MTESKNFHSRAAIGPTAKPSSASRMAGREQLGDVDPPVAGVKVVPAADCAGRGHRQRVAVGNAAVGQALDHRRVEGERCAARAVIGERLAVRLDDHGEEVAADPGRHRLDHAEDGVGRDRRVDRGAAAIEDVECHVEQRSGGRSRSCNRGR